MRTGDIKCQKLTEHQNSRLREALAERDLELEIVEKIAVEK